jgi:hypothetical protein
MRVRNARDAYLAENGFTVKAYDEPRTEASFLGIKFSVPNTQGHRVGIMFHDLHHVATGFGTDLVGEGEISAWEIRGGLRGLDAYVRSIVMTGSLAGWLLAPRRTAQARKVADGARRSLFDTTLSYEALLDLTVGELRAMLGVPSEGATSLPRRLHSYAPPRTSDRGNHAAA